MLNLKYIFLIILPILTGCASSSHLEESANLHAKAGDYYQSIRQPYAAREAYKLAKKDKEHANDLFPIMVDLYELLN